MLNWNHRQFWSGICRLEASIKKDPYSHADIKQHYLHRAALNAEQTLKDWQSVIMDSRFNPDGKSKAFSQRDQRIIDYVEKAVLKSNYPDHTKDYFLEHIQKNPQDTLHFWQQLTRDFSFNPDPSTLSPENLVRDSLSKEQGAHEALKRQAFLALEKAKPILSEEEFKKLEATLPGKPQAIVERHYDLSASHEESLKLAADVNRFIELSDKVCQTSVLRSAEAKEIFVVLRRIEDDWSKDELFMEKLKESGNKRAYGRAQEYAYERTQARTQTQELMLER